MSLFPRALAFAAPAALVLGGSLYLSGGVSLPSFANPRNEEEPVSDELFPPSLESELAVQRVTRKQEAVIDLLEGRIAFSEAVMQFRDINQTLTSHHRGDDEHALDVAALQVLSFTRTLTQRDDTPYGEAMRFVEHQSVEWQASRARSARP